MVREGVWWVRVCGGRGCVVGEGTPHSDTFAVILDCASLLQDEIGPRDVGAVSLLDVGEGPAGRRVAEGEP